MGKQHYSAAANKIIDEIKTFAADMVEIRHDLHAHPELGYQEQRTSAVIEKLLKGWGYEVTPGLGKTGVVGQLKVGTGQKSIGLRADFDALPIEEMTNLDYRSKNEGKMHVCGHDGHTAMLLTAARYLAQTKSFNGTLNVIFQPAEESLAGAKAMIDDGLFKKFPCDAVFGMHNMPGAPAGYISSRIGSFMPSSDSVKITVIGRGGHGAVPEKTVDPIVASSSIIMALQTVVSRNVPPLETAVVTVGSFHAGHAQNVISDRAEMLLTVRCFSNEVRDLLQNRIETIAKSQAESFGARVEIDYSRIYPPLVNHEKETLFATQVAQDFFGAENVDANSARASGSEDFAFMLEECPGCYLTIGNGDSAPLHNAAYDFNDENIPLGAAFWAALTQEYLRA